MPLLLHYILFQQQLQTFPNTSYITAQEIEFFLFFYLGNLDTVRNVYLKLYWLRIPIISIKVYQSSAQGIYFTARRTNWKIHPENPWAMDRGPNWIMIQSSSFFNGPKNLHGIKPAHTSLIWIYYPSEIKQRHLAEAFRVEPVSQLTK